MDNLAETGGHLFQLTVAFLLALPIAWDREQRERNKGAYGHRMGPNEKTAVLTSYSFGGNTLELAVSNGASKRRRSVDNCF